jgi:hypothetical protein
MQNSTVIVERPSRVRSKISNGSRMLLDVDGRSADARRYRDLCMSFADDLGGAAELSEAQRALVRQAATMVVQSERLQAAVVRGADINLEQLTRIANSTTRILAKLGIRRGHVDATPSLGDYLAQHHSSEAAE